MYINGISQTLARSPNTGTWNASGATLTSLSSNSISNSGKNFINANVCIRENPWRLNRQKVTTQVSNTIKWGNAISDLPSANANFYFDNKLELLDATGEWYYDVPSQTLYLMSDTDPNLLQIEASTNLLGIAGNDNRSGNIIQNLNFEHYADQGVRLMGAANNNSILNCKFNNNFVSFFVSGSDATIKNNTLTNSYFDGAILANMGNSTFSNNQINNVGMVFGKHRPDFVGEFYSSGIWLINANPGCVISENTITNCGNNGIRFGGVGITLEKNNLKNILLNMSDGGAIYTYGIDSHDNFIRNNKIKTVIGDENGHSPGGIVNGIYIDNYSYNNKIDLNTIEDLPVGSGIVINAGAHNNIITNNITYKCKEGLTFSDWLPLRSVYDNVVTQNTFYANLQNSIPISIASNDNNHNTMSICDNNFLCNPYSNKVVQYIWTNVQDFTLSQWQTSTSNDINSTGSFYNWTYPTDQSFLVSNHTANAVTLNYSNVLDLNNNSITSLYLPAFTSKILINQIILPVEITSFNAKVNLNNHVDLGWQTNNELNNKEFTIERSVDGLIWKTLYAVPGEKKSNTILSYNYLDKTPFLGVSYYRLTQTDYNGKLKIIDTRSVNIKMLNNLNVSIYPNPTNATITITGDEYELNNIVIYNSLGKDVTLATKILSRNKTSKIIDLTQLHVGIYIIKTKNYAKKIFKQ